MFHFGRNDVHFAGKTATLTGLTQHTIITKTKKAEIIKTSAFNHSICHFQQTIYPFNISNHLILSTQFPHP
jgi:hypothetical protein